MVSSSRYNRRRSRRLAGLGPFSDSTVNSGSTQGHDPIEDAANESGSGDDSSNNTSLTTSNQSTNRPRSPLRLRSREHATTSSTSRSTHTEDSHDIPCSSQASYASDSEPTCAMDTITTSIHSERSRATSSSAASSSNISRMRSQAMMNAGARHSRSREWHRRRRLQANLRNTSSSSSLTDCSGQQVRGESFCSCPQMSQSRDLQCTCGDDDTVFEWMWDSEVKSAASELSDDRRDVRFHVNYSSGTAASRGSQPLTQRQYFWEIKMTTPVYGTDMMVGVGTAAADLDAYRYSFCSLLGRDGESWGLSYYGRLQHKGKFVNLKGSRFGQGSIVGVHLDMWRGILSFYKNRQPLGVGYTGLNNKVLYPLVSSTAARTGMRLIKACSFQTSLQFLCCQVLRELVPPHLSVTSALQLPPGLHAFLTNNLSWLLRPNELSCPASHRAPTNHKRAWNMRRHDSSSSEDEEETVRKRVKSRPMQPLLNLPSSSSSSSSSSDETLSSFDTWTLSSTS